MTLYEAGIVWLILNELFVLYRLEVHRHELKQKIGSNRTNGLSELGR